MSFWSKERLEVENKRRALVTPYHSDRIEQNAYALAVSPEFAITSADGGGAKRRVPTGEHITIPPGQFTLLLTEEIVTVPEQAMAFISMKARFKLRGLVNVSGFHVDPGFSGKLKFAVYNAGSMAIDLEPGQRLFLIWYCDLDQPTRDIYSGTRQGQDGISAEDVMSIRGMVVSPAGFEARLSSMNTQLSTELKRIEAKIDNYQNWARPIVTAIGVGVLLFLLNVYVRPLFDGSSGSSPSPAGPRADTVSEVPRKGGD